MRYFVEKDTFEKKYISHSKKMITVYKKELKHVNLMLELLGFKMDKKRLENWNSMLNAEWQHKMEFMDIHMKRTKNFDVIYLHKHFDLSELTKIEIPDDWLSRYKAIEGKNLYPAEKRSTD